MDFGLSEDQHAAVESVTAQIVAKLLHLPTVRLKEAAAGANGGSYAEAVRRRFPDAPAALVQRASRAI